MKQRRWVVKVGSQAVCDGGPILLRSWMQQIVALKRYHSIDVIWVTSGAIASAVERTDFRKTKKEWELAEKQALSAIGQPLLMDIYNLALQATGILGAQILLTYYDFADTHRRQNFQNTVDQLLKWKVTPIINENDAIATEEIKFGDNDSLSAKVAKYVRAERLVILTDVGGLFEQDPKNNPKARLIAHLDNVGPKLLKEMSSARGSAHGTGGIYSKLQAAREALKSGIETVLVKADTPKVLVSLARGQDCGTLISKRKRAKVS